MPTEKEIQAAKEAIEDLFGRPHTALDAAYVALSAAEKEREDVEAIASERKQDVPAGEAEPLTSTSGDKGAGTGTEGPVNQDPPPGFTYEYRLVYPDGDQCSWRPDPPHLPRNLYAFDFTAERRIVGPPEQIDMEDE